MSEIPAPLRGALDQLGEQYPLAHLKRATQHLTQRYQEGQATSTPLQATMEEAAAYALARMPATYGAISSVLEKASALAPDFSPQTLMDVGAGPGTGVWAAVETFRNITQVTALEREAAMRHIAQTLAQLSPQEAVQNAAFHFHDLTATPLSYPPHDLVMASYIMGELENGQRESLLGSLWDRTGEMLIIVEPGTPQGYQRVLQMRDWLLAQGAYLLAPCPHKDACPLAGDDWCHFSARVARSKLQRQLKGGTAPYEDEKFSYVAMSRHHRPIGEPRVIRHPLSEPGRITLQLCTTQGLKTRTVNRRERPQFRQARQLRWGDLFYDPESVSHTDGSNPT